MRPFLVPPARGVIGMGRVPTLSIIVPIYQAGSLVGPTIESALSQTMQPVEVIVSYDESAGDLEREFDPYRDRVRLVRGIYGGKSAARNQGFGAASGDFVVNLDPHDLIHATFLEALGELAAIRPDLDILGTDAYLVPPGRANDRYYSKGWTFPTEGQRLQILRRNFLVPGALAAVRRTRFLEIGGFDETLDLLEDWDLWVRLILDGSLAGCVGEPLAHRTLRDDPVSASRIETLCDSVRVLEKAEASASLEPGEREYVLASTSEQRREIARLEIQQAFVRGEPGVRRQAVRAAFTPGHTVATRIKLASSALVPRLTGRALARREAKQERLRSDRSTSWRRVQAWTDYFRSRVYFSRIFPPRIRDARLESHIRRASATELWHSNPPQTFQEKVHHKMLSDRRPLLTTFADKVAVREYVRARVGTDILTELLLVTQDPNAVQETVLPREFALKASHGSGGCVIVADCAPSENRLPSSPAAWFRVAVSPDRLEWNRLRRICRELLVIRYKPRLEWAYRNVPPRILVEELLLQDGDLPYDYKFYVFHGRVRLVIVDIDRYGRHLRNLYSRDWEVVPVENRHSRGPEVERPSLLDEMVSIAERLGEAVDFVRVDLYALHDRVVFGEMTNYPGAGERFRPAFFDYDLGAWWSAPDYDRLPPSAGGA